MRKNALRQPHLNEETVRTVYKAWAPVYDYSFGFIAGPGRRRAVSMLNREQGRILEIGVGTGLSLPRYRAGLRVIGIDLSPDMLQKAAARANAAPRHAHSVALMDAGRLAFAAESFDAAAVMYVMTVVPDPAAVMAEMRRVLRPGATAVVVNHFSRDGGLRGAVERGMARYSRRLGWHPVFPLGAVLDAPGFQLMEKVEMPPLGLFTLLRLKKTS